MKSVDLLMFDLDGTLIDSRNDLADSVNETFRALGLPQKPREFLYGHVGNGVRRLIADSLDGTSGGLLSKALQIFETIYLEHLLDETCLYPGIAAVLEHFRAKTKAVVTNKPIVYTTRILEGLQADRSFDLVVGSESATQLKPHPEMLFKTLLHFRVSPHRAVMIGDSPNDILAARAAGVLSCGVGYGIGDLEILRAANPDLLAERPEDIKALFD